MKIDNIILSTLTDNADLLTFAFRDTRMIVPYVVKTLTGLDATDVISNFSGFGANSLAFFDPELADRTLVLRLGLNPTFRNAKTYSSLRDDLYRLIAPDRSGKIVVYFCLGEDKVASVVGKITKLEANHFESTPEAQLTIKCDSGLLRSPTINVIDVEPFGREFFLTDCISTAPHGMEIDVRFDAPSSEFVFKSPDAVFSVRRTLDNNVPGFQTGDIIHISSEKDNRFVRLSVFGGGGGLGTSIIEGVEGFRGSQWPIIYPGRNKFELVTKSTVVGLKYKEAWWGI